MMRRMLMMALGTVMAISLAACGGGYQAEGAETTAQETAVETTVDGTMEDTAGTANPFEDCESLEQAEKVAGFKLSLPDNLEGELAFRAINGKMIEVICRNGENEVRIRKSTGSDDISGDYNQYAEEQTVVLGKIQVTEKGDNSKINTAAWADGDYAYAVSADAGMDSGELEQMIQAIQ